MCVGSITKSFSSLQKEVKCRVCLLPLQGFAPGFFSAIVGNLRVMASRGWDM